MKDKRAQKVVMLIWIVIAAAITVMYFQNDNEYGYLFAAVNAVAITMYYTIFIAE